MADESPMIISAKKKSKMALYGTCKLTGLDGRFVDSHILPRALTRPAAAGIKISETALQERPISRPPSWYDNRLVIRAGEDILEAIDTPAIDDLRRHKLVWTSFPNDSPFSDQDILPVHSDFGVRGIDSCDAIALRLFFLSVLWRAAESSRREFQAVRLPPAILQDIKGRILARDPGDPWSYPILLDQLVTRGAWHNRTPFMEDFFLPDGSEAKMLKFLCVRIYIDGLVAKILVANTEKIDRQAVSSFVLGASDKLLVMARNFDQSRTWEDMVEIRDDNARRGYLW